MSLTERRQRLLAADRWCDLAAFVERWYAEPLSDADGHTPLEIERVARRLGARLPAALVEWYELVGRRLQMVQDRATMLDTLSTDGDQLRVWTENQGVWSITSQFDGDDPLCQVVDDNFQSPDAPLSQTLFGMLVSETLVGAWSGTHVGALGELGATVRGGYCEDDNDETRRRLASGYETLRYIRNPFFTEPYRGDATTIVRVQDVAVEWAVATDEAFAAIERVLDLLPEDGEYEVVVVVEPAEVARSLLVVEHLPDVARFNTLLVGVGYVSIATMAGPVDGFRFHIPTREPHRVAELLLAGLPPALLPHLTIATRPVAVSVFEVLYPVGKPNFVLRR